MDRVTDRVTRRVTHRVGYGQGYIQGGLHGYRQGYRHGSAASLFSLTAAWYSSPSLLLVILTGRVTGCCKDVQRRNTVTRHAAMLSTHGPGAPGQPFVGAAVDMSLTITCTA